jgi:hypothetical protein
VTRLRSKASALVLLAAIVAATGGGAFAGDRHPTCETRQHDCGDTAKIASCCCGDVGAPRDAGTPAQPRIDVANGVAATTALREFEHIVPPTTPPVAVQTSPPRSCLLDLPTLFASLLI